MMIFLGTLFLSGCAQKVKEIPVVETRTVEINKQAPIVPSTDQLNLRDVEWKIITPDNIEKHFDSLKGGDAVLFAITSNGYEKLALNLSDLRAYIQQQKEIIAIYESSYR